MAFLERAKQIYEPPSAGAPYAVPLPDSEQPGRSAVYRHWRFQNSLLKTMDPNVGGGERTGISTLGEEKIGQHHA